MRHSYRTTLFLHVDDRAPTRRRSLETRRESLGDSAGASSRSDGAASASSWEFDPDVLEAQAALTWVEESRLLTEFRIGGVVLAAGCGSGAFAARVAELDGVEQVTGVDLDAKLLALARKRLPDATFVEAAAEALPYPDDTFDAAIARLLLQHVEDPRAVIAELRRVVRPGGLVAAISVDAGIWGVAEPFIPELALVQAKLWEARRQLGGERTIGRRLHRIFDRAGVVDVSLRSYCSHSDVLGLDAFAPLLGPEQFASAVADGTITPGEYEGLGRGYARFRADPEAFILMLGIFAAGRVPGA